MMYVVMRKEVEALVVLRKNWANILTALVVILCLGLTAMIMKAWFDGKFNSVETLQTYILGFGLLAPLILTVIQAMQVVVPVLPGFLGCAMYDHCIFSGKAVWEDTGAQSVCRR